jgi:hypothetical protein
LINKEARNIKKPCKPCGYKIEVQGVVIVV